MVVSKPLYFQVEMHFVVAAVHHANIITTGVTPVIAGALQKIVKIMCVVIPNLEPSATHPVVRKVQGTRKRIDIACVKRSKMRVHDGPRMCCRCDV